MMQSHSQTSQSAVDLLISSSTYPYKAPAIVLSSDESMRSSQWRQGQREIAEEIKYRCRKGDKAENRELGLVRWERAVEEGHDLCAGRKGECETALLDLVEREVE